MKTVDDFSHSNFHLGVWEYYLEQALMFERFLQNKPLHSFATPNVIANPGKCLRYNAPGSDMKSYGSETLMEGNGSSMMPFISIHQVDPRR